jgi:hypothetical protein
VTSPSITRTGTSPSPTTGWTPMLTTDFAVIESRPLAHELRQTARWRGCWRNS